MFYSSFVALSGVPQLGPTPPYTLLAQSPPPIQAKLGEHPAQTLEDLRQALRENLEGQGSFELLSNPSFNISQLQCLHLRVRTRSHSLSPISRSTPLRPALQTTLFTGRLTTTSTTWCTQILPWKVTHPFATPLRNTHTFRLTLAPHQPAPLVPTPLKIPVKLNPVHPGMAVTLQTHHLAVPVCVFPSLPF